MNEEFLRNYTRRQFAVAYDKLFTQSILYGSMASSVVSEPEPLTLTIDTFNKVLESLPDANPIPRNLRLVASTLAVRDTGKKTGKYVERGWKERLLSRPWKPLKRYKLILVPIYEPVMYIAKDMLIYHPSLEPALRKLAA